MCVYDYNSVLTTEMKNICDEEMVRDFIELTEDFKSCGINPGFHLMDNDASTALKTTMISMNIKYQLVPTSNHRANNAERAIQTFKNHFISGLCRVDKYFHLQLWDRLLQQATISINFLRQSRTLPHLSAYIHIFGGFDFNRTPLATPGTRALIHNSPNDRESWAPHG